VATPGGFRREVSVHVPFPQFRKPGVPSLPLLPDDATQPPPDPRVQSRKHRRRLAVGEVSSPAGQVGRKLLDHLSDAYAPRPARQSPDPLLEPLKSLRRNPPPRLLGVQEAKTQESTRPHLGHRALLPVHLELEPLREEGTDALHHPLPGPLASDVDVAEVFDSFTAFSPLKTG